MSPLLSRVKAPEYSRRVQTARHPPITSSSALIPGDRSPLLPQLLPQDLCWRWLCQAQPHLLTCSPEWSSSSSCGPSGLGQVGLCNPSPTPSALPGPSLLFPLSQHFHPLCKLHHLLARAAHGLPPPLRQEPWEKGSSVCCFQGHGPRIWCLTGGGHLVKMGMNSG